MLYSMIVDVITPGVVVVMWVGQHSSSLISTNLFMRLSLLLHRVGSVSRFLLMGSGSVPFGLTSVAG